jgi:sulfur carrier protein
MQIYLNGEAQEVDPSISIAALLRQFGFADQRVAVERNLAIVPKSLHEQTTINPGDRLEIVRAMGGG